MADSEVKYTTFPTVIWSHQSNLAWDTEQCNTPWLNAFPTRRRSGRPRRDTESSLPQKRRPLFFGSKLESKNEPQSSFSVSLALLWWQLQTFSHSCVLTGVILDRSPAPWLRRVAVTWASCSYHSWPRWRWTRPGNSRSWWHSITDISFLGRSWSVLSYKTSPPILRHTVYTVRYEVRSRSTQIRVYPSIYVRNRACPTF